jgi:hypothetical protein
LRLKQRAQGVIARLCTLPREHPLAKVIERTKRRVKNKKNHPKFALAEPMRTTEISELEALETIDPKPAAPWSKPVFDRVIVEPDKKGPLRQSLSS